MSEELYRPTVRYDPIFKAYIEELFQATTLDRNELLRLALFCAPLSALFRSKIECHLKEGQTYLLPPWIGKDAHLWQKGGAGHAPAAGKTAGEAAAAREE